MMRASPTDSPANETAKQTAREPSGQVVVTSQKRVACEGSGDALGHPKIWLNIGPDGRVVCPYCSRQFVHDSQTA